MRFDKKVAILSLFASMTFVAISGATVGTLAWYAYTKNVTMSFQGTSVSSSLLLRVGLVDDGHFLSDDSVTNYNLSRESNDTHSIVWSNSANGFDPDALKEYLENSPYSYNHLYPVSSHSRSLSENGNLTLYSAPERGETYNEVEANKKHYVQLPFAFKVLGNNNENLNNRDIWLTDATVKASGNNVDKAVRVFIETPSKKFIMNPSDHGTDDSYTYVGGLLDLDNDGTYDYDVETKKELMYGEYTGTLTHQSTPYGTPYDDADFDNVNNTPYTTKRNTFYAKHNEKSYLANLDSVTPKKAEYHPFGKVNPSSSGDGIYYEGDTGIKIATTNSGAKVGYSTFTIYLEGWDHAIIDTAIGCTFSLGLEFNTNRL